MNNSITNPLYSPQREKSGSKTYSKYQYQYHWGLSKVLSKHTEKKEYALFVELHEDVVIADSLDSEKVRFSFNQVKTNNKELTVSALTKQKKGSSILGKLIDSCMNKGYSSQIESINLIAVKGFKLKHHIPNIEHDELCITDIEKTDYEKIEEIIKAELDGINNIPDNLYFVVPEIQDKGFEKYVIGEISQLINKLFPNSSTNPDTIYRVLIDELNRKGTNTVDYEKWDDALLHKSLTSITVSNVIHQFTQQKDDTSIIQDFDTVCSELSFSAMQQLTLKKAFTRYKTNKIAGGNQRLLEVSSNIKHGINEKIDLCNDSIKNLIELVSKALVPTDRDYFNNELELQAAIIFEYITKDED